MTGMKDTFRVINRMVENGVIGSYAITGAVAALNYIEPALTDDLDVLISVDAPSLQSTTGLVTLEPVFRYLRQAGYTEFRKEGVVIEGWAVQFLPVANALDSEGLDQAVDVEIEAGGGESPIKVRTLRAEHVVANALQVDRPKDRIRISQFLTEDAVDLVALRDVLDRHAMLAAWVTFCARTGIANPYDAKFPT